MKTKKNLKMPKPRNPFVQHLINRKQGVFKDKTPTRAEIKASLRKADYSDKFTIYPSSLLRNFLYTGARVVHGDGLLTHKVVSSNLTRYTKDF